MSNIFIQLKEVLKKQVLTRGSYGVVLVDGVGTLLENGISSKEVEISKNTNITVKSFDLYLNSVIVNCTKNKNDYMCSVPYSFLLNNCVVEETDKNKVIEAVYVSNSIKEVVDIKVVAYTFIVILTYLCGMLVGRV